MEAGLKGAQLSGDGSCGPLFKIGPSSVGTESAGGGGCFIVSPAIPEMTVKVFFLAPRSRIIPGGALKTICGARNPTG